MKKFIKAVKEFKKFKNFHKIENTFLTYDQEQNNYKVTIMFSKKFVSGFMNLEIIN